jgi:hypothetical protein
MLKGLKKILKPLQPAAGDLKPFNAPRSLNRFNQPQATQPSADLPSSG